MKYRIIVAGCVIGIFLSLFLSYTAALATGEKLVGKTFPIESVSFHLLEESDSAPLKIESEVAIRIFSQGNSRTGTSVGLDELDSFALWDMVREELAALQTVGAISDGEWYHLRPAMMNWHRLKGTGEIAVWEFVIMCGEETLFFSYYSESSLILSFQRTIPEGKAMPSAGEVQTAYAEYLAAKDLQNEVSVQTEGQRISAMILP